MWHRHGLREGEAFPGKGEWTDVVTGCVQNQTWLFSVLLEDGAGARCGSRTELVCPGTLVNSLLFPRVTWMLNTFVLPSCEGRGKMANMDPLLQKTRALGHS